MFNISTEPDLVIQICIMCKATFQNTKLYDKLH